MYQPRHSRPENEDGERVRCSSESFRGCRSGHLYAENSASYKNPGYAELDWPTPLPSPDFERLAVWLPLLLLGVLRGLRGPATPRSGRSLTDSRRLRGFSYLLRASHGLRMTLDGLHALDWLARAGRFPDLTRRFRLHGFICAE